LILITYLVCRQRDVIPSMDIFAVLIQGYRQIAKWIRIILVYRFTALSLNLIITAAHSGPACMTYILKMCSLKYT